MKYNLYLFITVHILITAALCNGMEDKSTQLLVIKKPTCIAFPHDSRVIVGGIDGCGIFNIQSHTLIHSLTPNPIIDLVANKEIIALKENRNHTYDQITIFNPQEGNREERAIEFLVRGSKTILDSIHHRLFCCYHHQIAEYDYMQRSKVVINDQFKVTKFFFLEESITDYPTISCHPRENLIIYPSDHETLSIIQPHVTTLLKIQLNTHLILCNGAEYSPDGTMILFNDYRSKQFIYDLKNNNIRAYELLAEDKDYIAIAFHPSQYLLALLSRDETVQYWNYLLRTVVAATHTLNKKKHKNTYKKQGDYLAFSPNGKHLAVALKNKWVILDTPDRSTNFPLIYYLLHINYMPQDLINLITQIIMGDHKLSSIDSAGLSNIAPLILPLPIPQNKIDEEEHAQYRDLEIIYHHKNA